MHNMWWWVFMPTLHVLFCSETVLFQGFFYVFGTQKNQKKGLKKGVQWFRMVSSGKEWWLVE